MSAAVYERAFWVDFKNRPAGCVEAPTAEDAKNIAETFGEVHEVRTLPYPALPRLTAVMQPHGSPTPSFCFRPESCASRTSCPQRLSCVE